MPERVGEGASSEPRTCPDGGACYHNAFGGCDDEGCFRVRYCEPLSGVFADDKWPVRVVEHQPATEELPWQPPRTVAAVVELLRGAGYVEAANWTENHPRFKADGTGG